MRLHNYALIELYKDRAARERFHRIRVECEMAELLAEFLALLHKHKKPETGNNMGIQNESTLGTTASAGGG